MRVARRTKSVNALLNEFSGSNAAISITNLVARLSDQMNRTTVYRILDRLESDCTLHSFIGKDGLKWYSESKVYSSSQSLNSHPHFQCSVCGKTECLAIDVSVPTVPNRKVDSAELLLIGQCEECTL